MTPKLKKLRDKLTEKQQRFVKLYKEGQDRADAYMNAGYKARTREQAQMHASRLMTRNDKVIEYFEALKGEDDRKTNISRAVQLVKLNEAFTVAKDQDNPSAMVSAIREQNEMLGYHRDTAPNPERELEHQKLREAEKVALARMGAKRTEELAVEPEGGGQGRIVRLMGA